MADSTSVLATLLLSVLQSGKEAAANNLFNAGSPADLYANNPATTTGTTWGYIGGRVSGTAVANGAVALTNNATNYVVGLRSTGAVSVSTATTNWNDEANYIRTYIVTTVSGAITTYDDYRQAIGNLANAVSAMSEEQVQDIVGSLITAGSGITTQYNDGDSPATFVISATGGGSSLTQEQVEDIVAALITAGSGISKQYNDGDSPATLVLTGNRSPAIQTVSSAATVTPTFADDMVTITAQAAGLTLANPTGTPIDGLGMVIRIKDNGTARSITYGSEYRAIGVTLPSTTVVSKTLYLALIYNATDTKWDVLAVGQEA